MDAIVMELTEDILQKLQTIPANARLLVGIAGIPASGKSTLAQRIVRNANMRYRTLGGSNTDSDIAILVGLDGWHLTRAQLDTFPDPRLAHDRRGAHWTFDGEAYVEFVRALRRPLDIPGCMESEVQSTLEVIQAPSFEHAIKDPVPHSIMIHPYHRIVIIEGLYTFLSIEPWQIAGEALDERWWVEVDEEEGFNRLVERHVQSGVAQDREEAVWRARENDGPNGVFIRENMLVPSRVIRSVEDDAMTSP